jgi:hypothetical protein
MTPPQPKAKGKAKAKPQPKPKAEPKAEPKRGRPSSNKDLKARLLDGGDIEDEAEYDRAKELVHSTGRQAARKFKQLKNDEAIETTEHKELFQAAVDRWEEANALKRVKRVQLKQTRNDLMVKEGLKMVQLGSRGNSELLTEEIQQNIKLKQ